jgi:hypothetical protein
MKATQALTNSRRSTPSDMRARKVCSVWFASLEVHPATERCKSQVRSDADGLV